MRRVVGAGILVIVLGGGHVLRWFGERSSTTPPESAARVAATGSVPGQAARNPAPEPASRPPEVVASPYPAAYRDHPLHFLSTAPRDSLALLPGIGPVLAGRIVSDRAARGPFTTWTEVDRVRGVGPATIRRLEAAARRR